MKTLDLPSEVAGRPRARTLCVSLIAAALFLAFSASSAFAARPHEFTGTLGETCTEVPCGPGKLKEPSAVAVNEATGDLYVLDQGNARVQRYSSTGVFLGGFDGSGTPAGSFEFPAEPQTGAIAVDNSCALHTPALTGSACEAFDPSAGDVYVADPSSLDTNQQCLVELHCVVDKFSPTGGYLSQIVPPTTNEIEGVAVDPTGKVWLYRNEAGALVDGYSNAEPNAFVEEIFLHVSGGFAVSGFAVDSRGNFYGNLAPFGTVTKWDHAGKLLIEDLGGEGSTAVSADQSTDSSFVDNGTTVDAFSPEGALVERLGTEGGTEHLQAGAGVGVDAASGTLYVADPVKGPIVVFGPSEPTVPKIESEAFSSVSAEGATLEAEVNPSSEEGEEATTWSFQYGPCASLATCASSPYGSSTTPSTIPARFEAEPVSAQIAGLIPNSNYHFRAVAHNSHGEAQPGVEVTFTTEALGGSLLLPDGRAWELVSPPDKQGALIEPISETGVVQAAAGGGGVTYLANGPLTPDPQGFANVTQILSTRSAGGWSTRDIAIPHTSPAGTPLGEGFEYKFFNPELTLSAVQPHGEFIPQLSAEASESTAYLHNLSGTCGGSCYRPLVTGKEGFENVPSGTVFGEEEVCRPAPPEPAATTCGPRFLGATEDLSHVVLEARASSLASGVPAGALYEWSAGTLSPVSVLPSGEAVGTGKLGFQNKAARGAISSDGSRIVFESGGDLYLRVDANAPQSGSGACDESGRACTIQLDAAEPACPVGECESGGGQFQIASADGSRVFFTDERALTADSGAEGTGEHKADLYECRIVEEAPGHLSCALTDLTPETAGGEAAEVQGGVLGASEDGSTVYFVAKGIQSEGANALGQKATAGRPNLYVHYGADTRFITTLVPGDGTGSLGDEHDWELRPAYQPTRVSPSGRFLALMSQTSLTGYDNRDRATDRPVAEVYLYDAGANQLTCASCEPSGERPVGVEYRTLEAHNGGLVGGRNSWVLPALVAANVPGWTAITEGETGNARYQDRYLSDSGRLFFNTADALVPQDSNGTQDVYEYEPPGIGGCNESLTTYSARSGGCVSLISSGTSTQESAFLDASESGDDVFFLTSARLSPLDVDSARDVYDAHVCSGASPCIPQSVTQAPACEGDACQLPATPPVDATPGSLSFSGAGNVVQCPRGKVVKKGRCVKKQSKAKKHRKRSKGKGHRKHRRSSGGKNNSGGGK